MIEPDMFPDVDTEFIDMFNDASCVASDTFLHAYEYNLEVAWKVCDNVEWMCWILLFIDLFSMKRGSGVIKYSEIRSAARRFESHSAACVYIRCKLPEITPLLPKKREE